MSARDSIAHCTDNDTSLLIAERTVWESLARADVHSQLGAPESQIDRLLDEIGTAVAVIFNTSPATLNGAAVKLRMLLHPELGIDEDGGSEILTALRQILECVEKNADQLTRRAACHPSILE